MDKWALLTCGLRLISARVGISFIDDRIQAYDPIIITMESHKIIVFHTETLVL